MSKTRSLAFGVPPEKIPELRPMGALLTHQAGRDPDWPALTFDGQTITRAELDARANRRARALLDRGVGEGDYVTIALRNGPEFHETAFAIWKIGAVPAPVPHTLPDIELRAIIELVAPKLVIGFDETRLPGHAVLPAGFEPDPGLSDAPLPEKISPSWKAITSGGSTGRPKVIVDHSPSVFDPDMPRLGMEVDDVILNPAPLYHNAPFGFTHMAMCWGAHVVEMAKFDPVEALRLIERHRIKWVYLVPTMMNRIAALPDEVRNSFDVSSIEMVIHMAAACPIWLKEKWIDWLGAEKIFELYAGTEVMGGTTISGPEWLLHKGSVGRVSPETTRIVNDDDAICAPGEIGEIFFLPATGKGSTYHYLGATAKAIGDWESYGDMGWLDADHYLYLADRRTDMIVSGGSNIYPAEVEAALDQHRQIASSVVVGLPDDDLGHRVHAIIEPRDDAATLDPADIADFVASRLARYKLPYSYEIASGRLRDDAGKVRRSALRSDCIERIERGERFARLR